MTDIAIVYDRSDTDELGIRLTANEMGVELKFLPFYKVAFSFGGQGYSYYGVNRAFNDEFDRVKVVLNRTQSKSRRLFASEIFKASFKEVLNPYSIEVICQSKVRTLLEFFNKGIKIPITIYIPCNIRETQVNGALLDNSDDVLKLIERGLGYKKVVVKPDAGTHGRDVKLAEDEEGLMDLLSTLEPSIINPAGVVAQEFIPKWFYDLRIIVEKEKGKNPFCYDTALARGGLKEFRTNTFLGNLVFGVELPEVVKKEAVKCGRAIGGSADSWVIALDAMPYIGDNRHVDEEELSSHFQALEKPFNQVKTIKNDPGKKKHFKNYCKNVEEAFFQYMAEESYNFIKVVIEDSLKYAGDKVYFHEGNACPEFWENTRIVAGINVANSLIRCAQSLLDT